MKISNKAWMRFIKKLGGMDNKAAGKIVDYLAEHEIMSSEGRASFLNYAFAVATKYGEGAATVACEMYDGIARAQKAKVPPALPAPTPTYGEVAKTVNGASLFSQNPDYIGSAVGNLVKRTGVDTTLNNALRDGAEWAWIPHGDTCPFCLTLASNGWQRASKKALKNGHANHIHANCDCTYAIRFDGVSTVEGYDPDALYEQYKNAEGRTSRDKINFLRRAQYAEDPEKYRAQSRAAYALSRASQPIDYIEAKRFANDDLDLINMLRSGNVQDISTAVDSILTKEYHLGESAWKKKVIIVDANTLRPGIAAVSDWDNIIKIRQEYVNDLKTHIHEHLHMRSINKYGSKNGPTILAQWLPLEEGTVEYLSQEICERCGIRFKRSYKEYVDPIERFRQITKATQSKYDFARELFDKKLTERYNYLQEIADAYKTSHPHMRKAVEDEIADILTFLKGGAK